ncbi:IscS subfamily cysteine desulfurase [Bacillus spongiae]|uniref:IscS subfamily cysteine desulfurase n=1 Tax=Bacillus spongiae TaxID=2683610 RepID=A0ABU8H8P7_9BACI
MKYFDYAATTPMDSDAIQAYSQVATQYFGNTSSLHDEGSKSQQLLETCRQEWGKFLQVPSEGIYFTASGTESNLIGIISLAQSMRKHGNHIITTLGEHTSVHSAFSYLEKQGFQITKLPLNKQGQINLKELESAIQSETILIAIQTVNGEIGSIQPIEDITKLIHNENIVLHCDAVQSFGKLDLSDILKTVDSFSISSHKVYGPKGTGLLYINPSRHPTPIFPELTHEKGIRGGTIDVPSIAAFTVAGGKVLSHNHESVSHIRELFLKELTKHKLAFTLFEHNDPHWQLPHVVGLGFDDIQGQWIMLEANRRGFAISTGSACSIGQQSPSKTMLAMGVSNEQAKEFIRISFSHTSSETDVLSLAQALKDIVNDSPQTQSSLK